RGAARLQELSLAPGERGFRVEFAALDFTAPERNAYRYRLEGFDDRWIAAGAAERSLAYTSLPPGGYLLRIQGTNRAGLWSPHEIRLPVVVRPALYQTRAFAAAVLLALAALAYGAYRLRVRQLQARGRQLARLVGERTESLAAANREL